MCPRSTNEVPYTLIDAPAPRLLGLADQAILWGNLGVSILLLPVGALLVAPDGFGLSLAGALAAILVGGAVGNAMLGAAAVPGADTGAPSMVLLRGLFGARGSLVPTALNVAQLVGWTSFEIWIIATAAARITKPWLEPAFAVVAGAAAVAMAIRPLGTVRGYLRRLAVWAVAASTAYLWLQLLRHGISWAAGRSWSGFWPGADLVAALSVSWVPLAPDYSRHSRRARDAFGGTFLGYMVAASAFFALGAAAALANPGADVVSSVLAIPAGGLALLILAADETDEAFANLYSAVVSLQNARPDLDRRWAALVLGAACTAIALAVDGDDYERFLLLLGSVFVPLFGTFAAEYFVVARRRWVTWRAARPRWVMLLPWAAGFAVYQLVQPGEVGWWADMWGNGVIRGWWASATLLSFATAFTGALAAGAWGRRQR